jgi:Holliday junction resolvase RusA-like endonuclease
VIEIILAGVPRGKQRVKVARDGHSYTPEKTVSFEGRLSYAAQQVMRARPLLEGALILDLVILVPVPKSKPRKWREAALAGEIRPTTKPDFDNYAKMVDALNMVVWVDDALVVRGVVDKFYHERPLFAARIRPMTADDRVIPEWVLKGLAGSEPESVFS